MILLPPSRSQYSRCVLILRWQTKQQVRVLLQSLGPKQFSFIVLRVPLPSLRHVIRFPIISLTGSLGTPRPARRRSPAISPRPQTSSSMASNPVIDPTKLKAHLNLLRAFYDLKSQVEDGSRLEPNAHTLSPEERWESFVRASVERCAICESSSRGALTSSLL